MLQENYKFLSSQTMKPPNTKQVACLVLGLVVTRHRGYTPGQA